MYRKILRRYAWCETTTCTVTVRNVDSGVIIIRGYAIVYPFPLPS